MPAFSDFWDNHPSTSIPPDHPGNFPCRDKHGAVHAALENQCAIRLGIALQAAGVNTASVPGTRCWNGHGRKHILRVLDFIPWIEAKSTLIGCKKKVVHKNVTHADFLAKQGICYFQNFYGTNNRGDHLDLWNGAKIAKGDLDYFERSEEVWFWEM